MLTKTENLILEQALEAFFKETGLRLVKVRGKGKPPDLELNTVLALKGHERLQFPVEIKKWAQHVNPGMVMERVRRLPGQGLLVADYINPNMAQRLRDEGIQFIDAAGNAYLNAEPLYVFIKGNRKTFGTNEKEEKLRAFTQTGLKVVFAFLCEPDLVKAAYREIAEKADVALGTVGWVVGDLKRMGYLIDRGNPETRRLNKYFDLLDLWVGLYPGVLRPKQVIGEFNKDAKTDTRQIIIEDYEGYWGGENAGAKYTGYLRGEIDTIYIPENRKTELIRDLKLFKGGEGNYGKVKLYTPFWRKPENYNGFVHPVLAYADLIATGDARNIETAKIIKDEYIKPLWQD